jgi:NitT/TauT family transport system substrate-binding protein
MDPTIKPILVNAIKADFAVLQKLGRVKQFDVDAWVNESYVREAFKQRGMNYDAQKQTLANYDIEGKDPVCNKPVTNPKNAGEIWIAGGDIVPLSSPLCTFMGIRKYEGAGKKIAVAYVFDQALGIKVFADKAFYAVSGSGSKMDVVPFLLKKDAEASAAKSGGTVATYEQVLAKMEK